jgi:hypothetical protein
MNKTINIIYHIFEKMPKQEHHSDDSYFNFTKDVIEGKTGFSIDVSELKKLYKSFIIGENKKWKK